MPVPPKSEQTKLVTLMTAVDGKIRALGQKETALKELKKSLMHDLLTGAVRVDPALLGPMATGVPAPTPDGV